MFTTSARWHSVKKNEFRSVVTLEIQRSTVTSKYSTSFSKVLVPRTGKGACRELFLTTRRNHVIKPSNLDDVIQSRLRTVDGASYCPPWRRLATDDQLPDESTPILSPTSAACSTRRVTWPHWPPSIRPLLRRQQRAKLDALAQTSTARNRRQSYKTNRDSALDKHKTPARPYELGNVVVIRIWHGRQSVVESAGACFSERGERSGRCSVTGLPVCCCEIDCWRYYCAGPASAVMRCMWQHASWDIKKINKCS